MKAHFTYLWCVLRHKWFVFLESRKLGVSWLGIVHDWSKFLPSEFAPYAQHFYGNQPKKKDDSAFDIAWLHHQKRNRHHWQYWMLIQDNEEDKVLPMPGRYRSEMLADWHGAGRAYGNPNTRQWYEEHKHEIIIHAETRAWIESQLGLV